MKEKQDYILSISKGKGYFKFSCIYIFFITFRRGFSSLDYASIKIMFFNIDILYIFFYF